jgi:hypothetical protein
MPRHGLVGPEAGTGLLPWKWAHERLVALHDSWPATVRPDGSAHPLPIWGMWDGSLDEDDFTGSPTRWSFPKETT